MSKLNPPAFSENSLKPYAFLSFQKNSVFFFFFSFLIVLKSELRLRPFELGEHYHCFQKGRKILLLLTGD